MSSDSLHSVQMNRPDRHRPSIIRLHGAWLARVYDAHGEYHVNGFSTLPEAYAKACDLAALIERQRHEAEPTA